MSKLYPLMFKLTGKNIVIIGGGRVALRKAQGLSVTGGNLTVVSPDILPELLNLANVKWLQKTFAADDIKDAHIVYAATNHSQVNESVAQAVKDWQWFNDTSQPERSNFYTPAVLHSDDLTLAVSTGGRNPVKAKQIKQQLKEFLSIKDDTIT